MRPAQNRAVPDPPRPTLLVSRAMSALTAHGPFASHSTMEIVDCKGSPTATHQHFRWSEPVWSPPPESNRRPHPYHGSAAKRRANPRLRRSRDTVHAAVMGSVAVASPASAYQHMSYPVRRLETEDRFHKPRAFLNIGLHDGLPHWMYVLDLQRSRLQELQAEGRNLGELLRSGQLTDWKLIPKWQGQLLADGH